MSADSLWDCHDVGNAIKIQIKKSHDESERIQWNREQCVFFKYYIDAYCSTYDTAFTSAQMRQICDIALPSKLWDIYEKVGSLISQSDNSKYEFVILKAETAGIFDAANKGQNLYNYLVGKNISSKNPVQQEASPRRTGYKESPEFSTKSNRETTKSKSDSGSGSPPKGNNESQFNESEEVASPSTGFAFVMLALLMAVGLFVYFSDKGYKYPNVLEQPQQVKLKVDSSSQPAGGSGNNDSIANQHRDIESHKQEMDEILQKLDQDSYDLEIQKYELKITELLDDSFGKKALYLDRKTDWATINFRFTSDGGLYHYQLVDAFKWDQDILNNVITDVSLPKPPLNLSEISVQVLLPLKKSDPIRPEVAKEMSSRKAKRNDSVTIDEVEINEVKPRPEVEYLEKPTHFDFKITAIGELVFDEEQGLQVTIQTNWSDYFSAPIISIAPVELYYVHSVIYEEELVRDLDIRFNKVDGTIILKNPNSLEAGKYTVLLEIINGRSEIKYQTVSFKLKKNLTVRKKMQQWKERLDKLRD